MNMTLCFEDHHILIEEMSELERNNAIEGLVLKAEKGYYDQFTQRQRYALTPRWKMMVTDLPTGFFGAVSLTDSELGAVLALAAGLGEDAEEETELATASKETVTDLYRIAEPVMERLCEQVIGNNDSVRGQYSALEGKLNMLLRSFADVVTDGKLTIDPLKMAAQQHLLRVIP